jgi:hypothetical protein
MYSGGKVIGQGTYGCAVTPPLICKGRVRSEKRENQEKVGKVTLDKDAATELLISKLLRKDPLWKNYYILPDPEVCEPIQKERADDWAACEITGKVASRNLKQITSDFGGRSFGLLGSTNLRHASFDFFFFFKHLLEAGALLCKNQVSHYDLHRSNILVDTRNVPRLVDFGMSFSARDITTEILDERWKVYDPKYDSEPPEITVLTGVRNGVSLEKAIQETVTQKPIFKEVEIVFGIRREALMTELTHFFNKSKTFRNADNVGFWKIYWTGFDSFALGALFLSVLKTQLVWPEFVQGGQWIEKGALIQSILRRMLHVVPSERYDCIESLNLYDPGNVVLQTSGAWIAARKAQRS